MRFATVSVAFSFLALASSASYGQEDTAGLPVAPAPTPLAPVLPEGGVMPLPDMAALPPPSILTDRGARAEAERLRRALRAEVPHTVLLSPLRDALTLALARDEIARHGPVRRPQLLVVVDRNPSVQLLQIVVALPDAPWQVIGGTRVSTGQSGRKFLYITPTGVFENSPAVLGYRAEGTFNEHHVRGNGLKGMRVWDFGWHEAVKGWLPTGETGPIRLEVHATDPTILEARIGHPASEGCIRVPSAMNRFLDLHGVLDVDYERAAGADARFRSLLLPGRHPTKLAGNLLVVIDSSDAST